MENGPSGAHSQAMKEMEEILSKIVGVAMYLAIAAMVALGRAVVANAGRRKGLGERRRRGREVALVVALGGERVRERERLGLAGRERM